MERSAIRTVSVLGLALALIIGSVSTGLAVQAQLPGTTVPKFVDPLPVLSLDPAVPGIPVALGTKVADPAMPNGVRQDITISMCEFRNSVLPTVLPPGTLDPGADGRSSVWGYRIGECPAGRTSPIADSYIGPVVIAERHVPTRITFQNRLGDSTATNVLAYKNNTDLTLMWADPLNTEGTPTVQLPDGSYVIPPEENVCSHAAVPGEVPSVLLPLCADNYYGPIPATPHLHGGEVPAVLDGGPDAWWAQNGLYGHGYYSKGGFGDAGAGNAVFTYPNSQEAAPLWFHDHVLGATRLNVYAGIAGAYMVTEPDPGKTVLDQSSLLATGLLPLGLDTNGNGTTDVAAGSDELLIPIVLQDRAFDTAGELFFHGAGWNSSLTHPFWVPEFVGDTIAVNGKVWPFLNVQPKRYRFLFINGSNARAYELFMVEPAVLKKNGKLSNEKFRPNMWVIGNDQGYLDAPVQINPNWNPPKKNKLVIMPGERYEVIMDFGGLAGKNFEMRNTAAIPYPFGNPVVPGLDDTIMQFRVGVAAAGFVDMSYNPDPATGGGLPVRATPIVRLTDPATGTVMPGVTVHKYRRLTLNEAFDPVTAAPVMLLMNNTSYIGEGNIGGASGPRSDFDPVVTRWNTSYYSELPNEGETEIWEIVNFSADAHPIHPHLVAFQVLNRQAFDAIGYQGAYDASFPSQAFEPAAGPPFDYNCNLGVAAQAPGLLDPLTCVLGGNPDPTLFLLGPVMPPNPQEQGFKDTAISYPGEILRLLIRYTPTAVPAATLSTDAAAAYEFGPDYGHGYVWHCHIIDHEDNEMMRPFNVTANANSVRIYVQGTQY